MAYTKPSTTHTAPVLTGSTEGVDGKLTQSFECKVVREGARGKSKEIEGNRGKGVALNAGADIQETEGIHAAAVSVTDA